MGKMKSLAVAVAAMFAFELATVSQVFGAVELRLTNDGGLQNHCGYSQI